MMKLNWFAAAVLLFPLGCGKAMTPEQKIEMLEAERQQVYADLHRQQAECQAQAIEFANTSVRAEVVTSCLDAYRVIAKASIKIISNFDRRIEEIRREQLKNNPFNQFDDNGKKLDLTYDPNWKPPNLVPFNGKLDGEK